MKFSWMTLVLLLTAGAAAGGALMAGCGPEEKFCLPNGPCPKPIPPPRDAGSEADATDTPVDRPRDRGRNNNNSNSNN